MENYCFIGHRNSLCIPTITFYLFSIRYSYLLHFINRTHLQNKEIIILINPNHMKPFLLSIFLLSSLVGWGQSFGPIKVVYHEYSPTSSDYDIIRWNVNDTTGLTYVLKETTDNQGRVVSLEFLKNGNLIDDQLCYLPSKIKFSYQGNTIIQNLYRDDTLMFGYECDEVYRSVYTIDCRGYIILEESNSWFDSTGMTEDEYLYISQNRPDTIFSLKSNEMWVWGYVYSFYKKDGVFPVSYTFNFKKFGDLYGINEPELSSVREGVSYHTENKGELIKIVTDGIRVQRHSNQSIHKSISSDPTSDLLTKGDYCWLIKETNFFRTPRVETSIIVEIHYTTGEFGQREHYGIITNPPNDWYERVSNL